MSSPPLTLTSLLNSLHSHLQSQTQLLPTLHLQLGLPPSALEDELQVIQQQLIQSVEAQIEVRRKEVEAWLEKCDAVEKECLLYAKALGGNAKSAGSSVGELRKEQGLPKRFELVSAHQEKLRQVRCSKPPRIHSYSLFLQTYHTKLEQFTNLTTRLQNLSRTLGPGFYVPDILGPIIRIGEITSQHRDVTPERFSKLEKELVRGKSEIVRQHPFFRVLV
jgi:protein regulator of cytokinesis 1